MRRTFLCWLGLHPPWALERVTEPLADGCLIRIQCSSCGRLQ